MENPREVLRGLEQRARKRFGQNFLTQEDIVGRIVRGAGVKPGDKVIEVGPGLGALTDALLAAEADLTVIELDRDLASYLRAGHPNLRLIEGDATRLNWGDLTPGGGWKVVANLPFNVGTQLVVQLLQIPASLASVTVMLQQEVVARILAAPGSRTYGSLSVMAQSRASGRYLIRVPSEAFYPPPKVEGAVVRLDLYSEPRTGGVSPEHFDKVVRAAFSQRRKTLINSMAPLYGKERVAEVLAELGIDPLARAEVLSLADYQRLAPALL
ncbi:MAG: ribosomal RNA small subunit methyltransferase A [Deltaproteobacteria bacterium]|nr:ribosomal RNA small subunit methyltransferase A [Deltaproteobacteria bacterium]